MGAEIELLAPAGGMESLEAAFHFGADAVYLAGKNYGLRAFADNFGPDDLNRAVLEAKAKGKKIYLTVNAFFHNRDFINFGDYLKEIGQTGVDALIVSDPGVLFAVKETLPDMEIHLSTQANTTNYKAARFWYQAGVSRVILAREMSLEEIREIRENTPEDLTLEAFVHGAMCISYSGRCLLSTVFTGRSGNAGACAQPCRWEYHVSTKGYEGEYFPVMEDDRGTYIFNSKDLMMLNHLDALYKAGVTSFKIEGRMKSAYYTASVVKAYRKAADDVLAARAFDPALMTEIEKIGTRQYTTGFFFGNPRGEGQDIDNIKANPYMFAAKVLGRDETNGLLKVEQRNRFFAGDELEALAPKVDGAFTVNSIINEAGEAQQSAPHPQQTIWIDCPLDLHAGDMLRKKIQK